MKKPLWAIALLFASPLYAADWQVQPSASSLSFVSTKNVDIAESHRFGSITGALGSDGSFALNIDLKSLDTKIPIRDDRIHEHVFRGAESATVSGTVDTAAVGDIGVGESQLMDLTAELMLMDSKTPLLAKVRVIAGEDQLRVVSTEPLLLNMRVLGLGNGIEKLRQIAGLTSISMAVPAYFDITLRRQP